MRTNFLLALVLVAGLPAADFTYYLNGSAADVTPKTQGGYLLMGGGRDDPAAFRWFLQRAGGGDIVILRASGSDGYHDFIAEIAPVDSIETIVFHSAAAARDEFVLGRIRQAEAIFLAGGNQWNYERFWRDSPVAAAVNDAARRGVPIGGTSAGLAVLGQFAFSAEHGSANNPADLVRDLFRLPGLECVLTDSHFSQRNRMGRLRTFMEHLRPACANLLGLGVDERTSVLLEPNGATTLVGPGTVYRLRWRDGNLETDRLAPRDRLR